MYVTVFNLFFSIHMHLNKRYGTNMVFHSLLGARLLKEVALAIITPRIGCTGNATRWVTSRFITQLPCILTISAPDGRCEIPIDLKFPRLKLTPPLSTLSESWTSWLTSSSKLLIYIIWVLTWLIRWKLLESAPWHLFFNCPWGQKR